MPFKDDFAHLEIPLGDIKAATNDFSDEPIGRGGFGDVYKGELLLQKGKRMVAFKRLDRKNGQGDVEFRKEIMMLSELKHKNLASLLHYCCEDDERILVYKYAHRGSLDRYLGDASLTWIQRLIILIGAARGIAYLHDPKKTQQRVLHRDIKSSNILLDDKWTPKVSDFGLSKNCPAHQPRSYLVSNVVGTPGYCDPAYWETGILSKETDVYSFGVVLSELLSGRLCCEYDKDKLICILVHRWKNCYDEDRPEDITFPVLKEQINQESLLTFAAIANRCLNREQKKRPDMDEVILKLELALHHQIYNQHKAIVTKTPVSYRFMEEFHRLRIQLKDIELATNNFSSSKLIGRNGFGQLYSGKLSLPEGQITACFKRLDHGLGQGEIEFWKEIMMLSEYKHENIVSLLGFCDEGDENILVYEHATHGSLDCYLNAASLTWMQRLKICLDVARGLSYLHVRSGERREVIVHRDIKSANILLDEQWSAKISDFGLSRASLEPKSAPGYVDPSYWETDLQSKAADVYSLGVVLFELLCGRQSFEHYKGKRMKFLLHEWRNCYDEKRLDDIILSDPILRVDRGSLHTFSSIAYQSTMKFGEERPTMAQVVKELELALTKQVRFEDMSMTRIKNSLTSPMSNTSQNQLLWRLQNGTLDTGDGKTMATNSVNNFSLRSLLEKDKLNGTNFLEWYRNLRIILKYENKLHIIEEPLPEPPPENASVVARNAWLRKYDEQSEVGCIMVASMIPNLAKDMELLDAFTMIENLKKIFQKQPKHDLFETVKSLHACKMVEGQSVSSHVLKMKSYIDQLELLGAPMGTELATMTILNSLPKSYDNFIINYNMQGWEKSVSELHAMLKTVEQNVLVKAAPVLTIREGAIKKKNQKGDGKGKGKAISQKVVKQPKKKENLDKDGDCYHCGIKSHWRRDCPKYLVELKKDIVGSTSKLGYGQK